MYVERNMKRIAPDELEDIKSSKKSKGQQSESANELDEIRKLEEEITALSRNNEAFAETKDNILNAPYFDRKLGSISSKGRRQTRALNFLSKGAAIERSEQLRLKQEYEKLKLEVSLQARTAGIDGEVELVSEDSLPKSSTLNIEWWDSVFLQEDSYDALKSDLLELVNNLIHHPVPIESKKDSAVINSGEKLMLTLKERKKARRLRRQQEQKDRQEKIKLGILPVDQPKAKLSNMINIFGSEAILEPSKIEKIVQDQVKNRLETHLQQNMDRALTKEEKRLQKIKKYNEETSSKIFIALFRIKNLSNASHKFKVDRNAKHSFLNGVCILNSACNAVYVEGGPKGIQRFKNLMLHRINWIEDNPSNSCDLVWEGEYPKSQMRGFKFLTSENEDECKEALGHASHLWEAAKNYDRAI